MRNIRVGKQTFVMTEKDEMKMKESGVNMYGVRQRIKKVGIFTTQLKRQPVCVAKSGMH